jgi:hypothetical protein
MTILHYLSGDFGLIAKVFRCSGYSHAESAWAISKSRLDNGQITDWAFVQYILRWEMPAEYVRRAFSRSHQHSVCQSNVYLWYREGRGEEYRMHIVQSE